MPVRLLYEQTLAERGYQTDDAQLRAVASLERCENEWADYKAQVTPFELARYLPTW